MTTHPTRLIGSLFHSLRLACMARLLPVLLLFLVLPGTVFAQPGAPSLSAPANGANAGGSFVIFSWTAPSGSPTKYNLQIDDSSTFASTTYDGEPTSTSQPMQGFPNDGTVYYWRVRAYNSSGWGAWSVARSFTNYSSSLPGAPSLSTPANGATNNGGSITFSWTAPSGSPTKYYLQAGNSSTFATTAYERELTSTSRTVDGFLNDGTVYYWRVRAYNSSGWGAWSVVHSFTIGGKSVPGAPSLSSPATGATVSSSSVKFSWTAPSGSPTQYELQVSDKSTFETRGYFRLAESARTSNTLDGFPEDGTVFYWRVRASNSSGGGPWSETRSFTTGGIPPGTWTAAETNKFQLAVNVDTQGRVIGAYLKVYFNDGWFSSNDYSFSASDITLSGKSVLAKKEIAVFNSTGDRIELHQIAGTFQPNGTLKGTWKSSYYHDPVGMSPRTNSKEGVFTATNPAIKAPIVTTAAASRITSTSATLNGTVNPNGATTTAFFEYGLTTAYGSKASVKLSPADASKGQNVSASISGLQPGRTYYYRLTATNEDGTSTGAGRTLATIRPGPAITVRQPAGGVLKNGAVSSIGSVAAGSKLSRTFTIENTGTENLTKLSVSRSGKNAKDFVVKGPLKTTLPPGGKTTFKITFKPTAKGVRKAVLHIRSNDKDDNPFGITVTGKCKTKAKSAVVKSARLPSWLDLAASGDGNRSHQTVGTTTLADGRKYLTLTVRKHPGGLLPERCVEVSSNLIDWYSGSKHTTILIDDAFLLKVRDNVPQSPGNKRYIRMKEK